MTRTVVSSPQTWLGKAISAVSGLPFRLRLAFEGVRERSVLQSELAHLDAQGELERVMSDAGISQSEMPQLINGHPGAARQFEEMMARAGVDGDNLPPTVTNNASLRQMQRVCNSCETWRQCREWLASHATDDAYREFCPNARIFDEMHERQMQLQADAEPAHRDAATRAGILNELDGLKGHAL